MVSLLPSRRKSSTSPVVATDPFVSIGYNTKLPTLPFIANLEVLPIELLSEVWKSLPLSSQLSLSYTCRHFRFYSLDSGCSIKSLFPTRQPTENNTSCSPEQWDFLCILERDQSQAHSRDLAPTALCSSCKAQHPVTLFSQNQLHRDASERQCVGRQGKLWLCPHTQLSSAPLDMTRGWNEITKCADVHHQVRIEWTAAILERSILSCTDEWEIREADIREALEGLEFDICPHLRINDPSIPKLYSVSKHVRNTFDKLACSCSALCRASPSQQCEVCNIRLGFGFRSLDWAPFHSVLYLRIRRHLPPFYDPTDPNWLIQIASPSKMESLNQQWRLCDEIINKQIPPLPQPSPLWGIE